MILEIKIHANSFGDCQIPVVSDKLRLLNVKTYSSGETDLLDSCIQIINWIAFYGDESMVFG